MLGRLLGLGLDVKIAFKPDRAGIVRRHVQQAGHIFLLKGHVGVEQGFIALPAAPKDIAVAMQTSGDFYRFLNLSRGKSENVGVGSGSGAVDVAGIAKAVGRAPENLFSGLLHERFQPVGHPVKTGVGFAQGIGFIHQIAVVEAVKINIQRLHQSKGGVGLAQGGLHRIPAAVRFIHGGDAEHVNPPGAHGVPVGHGKTKLLAHGSAGDDLVGVVKTESQRRVGLRPLVSHLGRFQKPLGIFFHNISSFIN